MSFDCDSQKLTHAASRKNGPILLPAAAVAALLSIGQRTLWRWVSMGVFPRPDFRRGRRSCDGSWNV